MNNSNQLLQFAIENGIIDVDFIQKKIEMNERKHYLEKHTNKIWQGNNGKWYTYLNDDNAKSGRKLIKKSSYESIEDAIIQHLKETENEPYIEDVFNQWLQQKERYGEIQKQSVERYQADFDRYIKESSISHIKVRLITEDVLENFIKTTIHEKQLTAKAWSNLRILIFGIFKYSKKMGYTNISITSFIGDLELSKKCFTVKKRSSEDNVFTNEEMKLLIEYLNNNKSIGNVAVLIAIYTGMRVGEIVALSKQDIFQDYIFVHRTMIRYHNESGKVVHEIRDTPKTEAGIRKIVIIPPLRPILDYALSLKQNNNSDFLFQRSDGSMPTKQWVSNYLTKACEKIKIKPRSMHVLRKTFATNLINNGVDESIIIDQMGHTDISTTKKYYYYNDKNMEEIRKKLNNAINYND